MDTQRLPGAYAAASASSWLVLVNNQFRFHIQLTLCRNVTCSEMTAVDYQVSIDDNDPPEEMFGDERPTQSAIIQSLLSANISVCSSCVITTCSQLLVAGLSVNVAQVTVAIETAYVAANAPNVTASDVTVDVTRTESAVDQSG